MTAHERITGPHADVEVIGEEPIETAFALVVIGRVPRVVLHPSVRGDSTGGPLRRWDAW